MESTAEPTRAQATPGSQLLVKEGLRTLNILR
jgi:hypothetical protein